MIIIEHIIDTNQKKTISRNILESLRSWFEIEESREKYIAESSEQIFIAARDENDNIGFLCLKETGKRTVELAVMGVLEKYHHNGIGRALFEKAKKVAKNEGYSFMQVKTVKMGVYDDYDITNLFYLSVGFEEFEVIEELWGEDNPCQIYVMSLK